MRRTPPLSHLSRRTLPALAMLVAVTAATGCGGNSTGVAGTTTRTSQAQPSASAPDGNHRGGAGSGQGGTEAGATLPAGWPTDVPTPPGVIQGSTHANASSWTVLTLAEGSAQAVMRQTVDSYRSAGFVAETGAILHNASHRVTINVENRDHSAAHTCVIVAVAGR